MGWHTKLERSFLAGLSRLVQSQVLVSKLILPGVNVIELFVRNLRIFVLTVFVRLGWKSLTEKALTYFENSLITNKDN